MKFFNKKENEKSIVVDSSGFKVNFSHFLKKTDNYSLTWETISKIYVFQLEPFELYLNFVDLNGKGYLVSEDMKGWNNLIEYMKKIFANFKWENLENAKFTMRDKTLCWSIDEP